MQKDGWKHVSLQSPRRGSRVNPEIVQPKVGCTGLSINMKPRKSMPNLKTNGASLHCTSCSALEQLNEVAQPPHKKQKYKRRSQSHTNPDENLKMVQNDFQSLDELSHLTNEDAPISAQVFAANVDINNNNNNNNNSSIDAQHNGEISSPIVF